MILGFGTANYEWKSNVLQADCVSIIEIHTEAQGIAGEEGSFEAIDKSYDFCFWVIKPFGLMM
jgi:iron complex outermembrane receptor protein